MSDQLITLIWTVVKIIAIILPITIAVAYYTYFARKIIGYMHARQGPNRIGPWWLIQPFADVFKMLFKELIIPLNASTFLYLLAPLLALMPALAAWSVIPFADGVDRKSTRLNSSHVAT